MTITENLTSAPPEPIRGSEGAPIIGPTNRTREAESNLELWQSDHFEDVSLAQWLAFTPYELVKAHLNIDRSVLSRVSAKKTPVV